MVIVIEAETADELFIKVAKAMIEKGERRFVRGLETIELADAWMVLNNPLDCVVNLAERNISADYLKGELNWYNSGSLKVDDIAKYSKFWLNLADSNGTVNSNYGFLTKVEKWSGISQFEWCINRLKKDKYTRQAIMNYNQPRHKYAEVKDFVCTISQQFIVREEKLDSIVLMRSNDLIYGLTYDIVWFCNLLDEIADILELPIGKYIHYDTSIHVYERHFEMLNNMANANYEICSK